MYSFIKGKLQDIGTFEELQRKGTDFAALLKRGNRNSDDDTKDDEKVVNNGNLYDNRMKLYNYAYIDRDLLVMLFDEITIICLFAHSRVNTFSFSITNVLCSVDHNRNHHTLSILL